MLQVNYDLLLLLEFIHVETFKKLSTQVSFQKLYICLFHCHLYNRIETSILSFLWFLLSFCKIFPLKIIHRYVEMARVVIVPSEQDSRQDE